MIVETRSPEDTLALGRRLGEVLAAGDVLSLVGDLGAGKTVLTKGVALGLGLQDAGIITSPTFVLMNSYEGRLPLRHLDLYRLESVDLESLGFHDLRPTSVMVVEWGEKAGESLGDRLEIRMDVAGPTRRKVAFRAIGRRGQELLAHLVPGK